MYIFIVPRRIKSDTCFFVGVWADAVERPSGYQAIPPSSSLVCFVFRFLQKLTHGILQVFGTTESMSGRERIYEEVQPQVGHGYLAMCFLA